MTGSSVENDTRNTTQQISPTYLGRYQMQHLHQFPSDAIYLTAWLHHQDVENTDCSTETLNQKKCF